LEKAARVPILQAVSSGPEIFVTAFRTIPIPAALAESARRERRSPQYGHPTPTELARGHGPCRLCLETFRVGEEERLLFTYNPFEGLETLPSPGPVFVHANGCRPFDAPTGFPRTLHDVPLVLDGLAPGAMLVAREHVAGRKVVVAATRIFANDAVRYIHVRNADAGCYVARLERVT
jgi:hypothetical protein